MLLAYLQDFGSETISGPMIKIPLIQARTSLLLGFEYSFDSNQETVAR